MKLLGITIKEKRKATIFKFINRALNTQKGKFIVTLNPEIILKTQQDKKYRKIINQADLKVVDGFGLKLVAWLKRKKIGERITGADLAKYILTKSQRKNLKIGLVVKKNGWSSVGDLKKAIEETDRLLMVTKEKNPATMIQLLKDREVLLIGLGAPAQEKFIAQIKNQLPELRLAMGVGGTFDYWTKKKQRAPVWMRRIGLEWLWRLVIQPNRIFRIWNATVVFLWKSFRTKDN